MSARSYFTSRTLQVLMDVSTVMSMVYVPSASL